MKVAIFADLHLSAAENTPQEAAFDWALQSIRTLRPNAACILGDISCCGSVQATLRFLQKLGQLSCPILTVPGNSDLRSSVSAPTVERLLTVGRQQLSGEGFGVVGLNLSCGCLPGPERTRLSALSREGDLLLVSHQGPEHIDPDSRLFMQNWIADRIAAGQKILGWVYGHIHLMQQDSFAGIPTISLCALDPDKNAGDHPGFLLLETGKDGFTLQSHRFTRGLPGEWSADERQEFAAALGVSCYDPVTDMPRVLNAGIRNIEWRGVPDRALPLLEKWRNTVGKSFSVHLPGAMPDSPESLTGFALAAKVAAAVAPDFVTVHPPQIAGGRFFPGKALFDCFADAVADALRPLRDVGTVIVIENNHTPFGSSRKVAEIDFGCTPGDIVLWRDALAARLGAEHLGLRLDLGHARNNVPLSEEYPLGVWYALLGQQLQTYHLHQTVILPDGHMQNHHEITGWHDGLISFDGFLYAWHTGILHHGPMILEIQHGDKFAVFDRLKESILYGADR